MIVRLSSISQSNHNFFNEKTKNRDGINKKIKIIISYLNKTDEEKITIFKTQERINELKDSLLEVNNILRPVRNFVVHGLILSNISYDELAKNNDKCKDLYKIINNYSESIKRYVKKNCYELDVSDIVEKLECKIG